MTGEHAAGPVIHIARLVCKRGREAELTARLQAVSLASRQEAGCGQYTWHRAIGDDGAPAVPAVLYSYEVWQSQAALEAHTRALPFLHFFDLEAKDPTLAEPAQDTAILALN